MPPASPKERFDVLLAAVARHYERFLESGFKASVVLTAIFGWMLSSPTARQFLKDAPFMVWATCALVGVLGATLALLNLFLARSQGRKIYARLQDLAYMNETCYSHYRLVARVFWSVVAINALLCALILSGISYSRYGTW